MEAIHYFSDKSIVAITYEGVQNIISNKTLLDGTTHEQTIICRLLFAAMWWALGQRKGQKNASSDNNNYIIILTLSNEYMKDHIFELHRKI